MIECKQCQTTKSSIWQKKEIDGKLVGFVCQKCHNETLKQLKQELIEISPSELNNISELSTKSKAVKRKLSKETLLPFKKTKRKVQNDNPNNSLKIRTANDYSTETEQLIKKQVEILKNKYTTLRSVRHNNINYEVGDIVSVVDEEDNEEYFAQCISFRVDLYQQKSVCYQWLFPDPATSWQREQGFVPSNFKIGPSDNLFHPIEDIRFVCSAPTNYFIPSTYYVNSERDDNRSFIHHRDYSHQVNIRS